MWVHGLVHEDWCCKLWERIKLGRHPLHIEESCISQDALLYLVAQRNHSNSDLYPWLLAVPSRSKQAPVVPANLGPSNSLFMGSLFRFCPNFCTFSGSNLFITTGSIWDNSVYSLLSRPCSSYLTLGQLPTWLLESSQPSLVYSLVHILNLLSF